MKRSNNPFTGALYVLRGMQLIKRPGLRRFIVLPLAINIALFISLGVLSFSFLNDYIGRAMEAVPEWLQWIELLVYFALAAGFIMLVFFSFTLLANLVSSPFNGPLAEAVEKITVTTSSETPELPWHESFKTLPGVLKEEFIKLRYSLLWTIPFVALLFIPGVNFIGSALWLCFSAWMLALQYMDYPFSNHDSRFDNSRKELRKRIGLTMGFGFAVLLVTMIPLLNLIIVPSAVAGASLMYVEQFSEES
ncbi:MAG: sulfate transporter CysZ [Gammaproteobacteria bacterium]|nr:sulfate transporter CysZ [Gammaproteobacteria bacterium]